MRTDLVWKFKGNSFLYPPVVGRTPTKESDKNLQKIRRTPIFINWVKDNNNYMGLSNIDRNEYERA